MLSHRFYYTLKPYLPWSLRMALRRISARNTLRSSAEVWPIHESARQIPPAWPGWPDGKRFAVVLTHDVEGPAGLAKCRRLMAIEKELGFRSSFNLIPEGAYRVTPEFRAELSEQGFELGVHDLRHDGKLFRSRRGFDRSATRINDHLREWGATGFRSGFMLRNLEWLHGLEIGYDSSTFDTDPFEFQPDGAGTIFPFWIPAPSTSGIRRGVDAGELVRGGAAADPTAARAAGAGAGYVELPYTLPQDSTLFLLLREAGPGTWLRKLDWIAAAGGMALVNVHPDYIRFEDEPPSSRTYPVAHYVRLLEHIRDVHAGAYWAALPRQVAALINPSAIVPRPPRAKRICMITHSAYERDNRVTRYAEALAGRGDQVDVFALRSAPELPTREVIHGVTVFRIQNRFRKAQRTRLAYLWPVLRFLGVASWKVGRAHARNRYDLVHVHNMPDFLVFAAGFPKLTGARVILDIHDIVPEFYASKFSGRAHARTTAILRWVERRSARFADHVIVSNHLWAETFAARTGTRDRCSVFINNVDSRSFRPGLRTRDDGKLIILFPGGLEWHQGVDIALRAFTAVSREFPTAEFHIYGDGIMKPALVALASDLGFNGRVKFFEPVAIADIARVMANADLGVVPKRADSFGNEAYSTKIMEFMSLGVPTVVSSTKIDRYYFNDSVVRFFDSGNPDALATGMVALLRDPDLRRTYAARAAEYVQANCWETRKPDYLRLVDSLGGVAGRPAEPTTKSNSPAAEPVAADAPVVT